ncbi:MAG: malto-oligosyltrehalose synthase [Xanthobacteraceae bacterium]|nr:malto-oligosyltrehalose synthase [Xanthobacteraceae bacterium]
MAADLPLATYRLQLTGSFGFDAAAAIVPYLEALGITHLYASPFLKARHGSTHGYDIIDHNALNPELGGEDAFARLCTALKVSDIGLILDFVPNHMGVQFADNPWWLDVLEWGPASPFAASFDIDWDTLPFRNRPGLLLPVLGTSYGEALDRGDIALRFDAAEGSFSAWYFEHKLPISPNRYSEILQVVTGAAGMRDDAVRARLRDVAARYHGVARPRRDEAPAMKAELAAIPGAAALIDQGLAAYRAGPGRTAETQQLHHLLERQHYRLADWRLATSEINYRRFFDVNTLAGLRVENAATFKAIHGRVARLVADGTLQGLRLDHVDGLRDPAGYCRRLVRLIRAAQPDPARPFYLVVEKILGEDEALPSFAGIHGTTGYEALNVITQLLVDDAGLRELDEIWRQASNSSPDFAPVLIRAKRRVLRTILTSEFMVLVRLLSRIAAGHYTTRDYSTDALRQALELYVVHFPVYRTYLAGHAPTAADRALIAATIARARAEWLGADAGIFDFLQRALTLDLIAPGNPPHSAPRVPRFALKLQQFTGPLMAKSLEDTAFYRYHRLLALNEVGGNPAAPALLIDQFHAMMTARAVAWPHAMTATSTHDTKRAEDARARIASLSELAGEWGAAVARWKQLNARHITSDGAMRSPSLADEYMIYQSLIGAWPLTAPEPDFTARVQAFALKAGREGKRETSWINPNEAYEQGVAAFVAAILSPERSPEFMASFADFARRTHLLGALNALTQLTLKCTMPGVPDFYQGTELWDFSMVDPDNRRPVDFTKRRRLLDAAGKPADWSALAARWTDGEIKLRWTHHLLALRRAHADVFTRGDFRPLAVDGTHRHHVVAFARTLSGRAVVTVACRAFAGLSSGGRQWPDLGSLDARIDLGGLALEGGHARHGPLEAAAVLGPMPAAVLPAKAAL